MWLLSKSKPAWLLSKSRPVKQVFLINNPVASGARRRRLDSIVAMLDSLSWRTTVRQTEGPGHATELAREAVESGADVVAVYGGDGTIIQAVEGIRVDADSHALSVPLGVIPGGTGNLLTANLGIPRNPEKAAKVIATGTIRTIDLGRVETAEGARLFVVGCGAGYDADLMVGTTGEAKRRWGVGAYVGYVVRTARNIRPMPFRVTIDGTAHDVDASSVMVVNCSDVLPPLLSLGPDVAVDDGSLDVVILRADGFFDVALVVWRIFRQRETEKVRLMRATEVRVESDTPRTVQADGDVVGQTPFTATIVPGGLRVLVPGPVASG